MGEVEKSLQERVKQSRRWETQRQLFHTLPTWNNEIFCFRCRQTTDHLELGFDKKEDWPLLVFCEKCSLVSFDKYALSFQDRVRQIREWQRWSERTGGPGPTDMWLMLLPGTPPEKTGASDGSQL